MKEQDSTKMEFLLTLNDNIVVQRYFNVRGYNPTAKNSIEFSDLINDIKKDLQYHLKMKTVIYMMDNSESIMHDPSVMDTSYTDGPEIFNILVKNGDTTICHRIFDGKYFPWPELEPGKAPMPVPLNLKSSHLYCSAHITHKIHWLVKLILLQYL